MFQFIKTFALLNVKDQKIKEGLSTLGATFVAFLSLNIGFSVLSNLLLLRKYFPPADSLIECGACIFSEGVSAEMIATSLYLPLNTELSF